MKKWVPVYTAVILGVLVLTGVGNGAVTIFVERTPIPGKHCIIIDAGHGGEDGGASSCTGRLESGYNLEIALRLEQVFHLLGYDTKMIRRTDTAIYTKGETIAQKKVSDLKERVRIVNETSNALLLSIHQNYFSDGRYCGAQVFYAATEGSQALAEHLQTAFAFHLDTNNHRKAKKAEGIYLMEKIQTPGVLVECGFLSNGQEESKLRDPEYQKRFCCVLAITTAGFLSNT